MSNQPDEFYVTPTIARHYNALVEIEWTFSSTLNRWTGCDVTWTHCASDDSDTYRWKPRHSEHARFLHQAAVEASGGGAQLENISLGRLNDESLWWPCKVDTEGVPVGRSGYSSGDCIVLSMSSGSGEEFWMEGVVVKVSTQKNLFLS